MAQGKSCCTHKASCELYERLVLGGLVQLWQALYCDANFSRCVRYQMAARGEPVPPLLMPNGTKIELPVLNTAASCGERVKD